jgi:ABC-2 type transport system permease protein
MRWFVIMGKDLSQALRDWKTAVFLLMMPLAFTVFFGLAAIGSPKVPRLSIGWIDRDAGGALGSALRAELAAAPVVQIQELGADGFTAAEAKVRSGKLAALVEVPAGWSLALSRGGAAPLPVIADTGSASGRAAVEEIRAGAGRVLGSAAVARLSLEAANDAGLTTSPESWLRNAFDAALEAWSKPRVTIDAATAGVLQVASGFTQASPGMMVQFAIFGLITSAMIIVLERKSGALRRLLTTPTSAVTIVGGHFTAMLAIVVAQEAILVLCGQLFFGVDYLRAPGATAVIAVALAAWAAALGLLIGALARTEQQVVAFSLAAMFIFSALGGAWFPLDVAGGSFARLGHLLPSAWAVTGLQNIVLRGEGIAAVMVPAGILLAWACGFAAIAVWRFRFE